MRPIDGTGVPRSDSAWDGGVTWTEAKTTTTLGTTESDRVVVSPTDTWGRTWSVGDFSNASFRLCLTNVAGSTSRDFWLDWVEVRVYY